MKSKLNTILFAVIGLLVFSQVANANTIELLVGEQKSVEITGISKVYVGDSSIVDVKAVKGNQLLLTGLASGVTTVSIITKGGDKESLTIKVLAIDPRKMANDIKQLIGDIEGISVRVVGDRVIIDGEVFKEKDMARVANVGKLYPAVTNFISYNKSYNLMKRLVQVKFTLWEVINENNRTLGLKVHEVLDNAQIGFNFLQNTTDTTQSVQSGADPCGPFCDADMNTSTTANQFEIVSSGDLIDITSSGGRSRKIDEHVAVTRTGEKVTYWNGGEIPLVTQLSNTITIEYKEWGFKFATTPELDKINNVVMDFDLEATVPDWAHTVFGFPQIVGKRTTGKVNMKEGEHVMIFGFLKKYFSKNTTGIPGFSRIPLLGYLFGGKTFQKEDNEGVLVVTPSVFQPVGNPTDNPRVQGVVDRYEKDDNPL